MPKNEHSIRIKNPCPVCNIALVAVNARLWGCPKCFEGYRKVGAAFIPAQMAGLKDDLQSLFRHSGLAA